MMHTLIQRSKENLDFFYESIKPEELEAALELCQQIRGIIFLSGVGKSGFIAEKIAMTLVSLGIKALFLNPANLLHGDLGIVTSEDVVILLSKSGSTKELVELVPFIQKRGAKILSVVSQKPSALSTLSDKVVYLPLKQEMDEFDLVPTTSTQIQLIFGDVLSMALMQKKTFKLEDYAQHHPSGAIGKKLFTKVEELMLPLDQVPFCKKNQSIKEVLLELTQKGCGCVLVADESRQLQGIFTDGDLRRSLQTLGVEALEKSIGDLMNTEPTFCKKDHLVFEAKKVMQKDASKWIHVLPILDNKTVVGLLCLHDILKAGI